MFCGVVGVLGGTADNAKAYNQGGDCVSDNEEWGGSMVFRV